MKHQPKILMGEQLNFLSDLNASYFVRVRVISEGSSISDRHSLKHDCCISVAALKDVAARFPKDNLFRSWTVYSDSSCSREIGIVPALVDIDDESEPPDIEKAYRLAEACIWISLSLDIFCGDARRIIVRFSGRKGFHLEFKPKARVDLEWIRSQLICGCKMRGFDHNFSNRFFGSTVIDPSDPSSKPWLRIDDSRNSWRDSCGRIRSRIVFSMNVDEFRSLGFAGIMQKAEAG